MDANGPDFDIAPFLDPEDPWIRAEDPALIRRLYDEKYRLARLLTPRSILEIGVRAGYSAAAFLAACPGATYLGLDADNRSYGAWVDAPTRAMATLIGAFPASVIDVRAADTQALDALPAGDFDLIHVDGDHSFAGCLHDLELAAAANPRWILVDDIDWHAEVKDAVATFLARGGFRSVYLPTVRGDVLIQRADGGL